MIKTTRKKLRIPRIPRTTIASLAGASPAILGLILMYPTKSWIGPHDTEWIKYLVQHQDDIIQTLIVSSIVVALFSTLLHNKTITFAAGLQPVIIQAAFILTDLGRHIALNISLAAITVLPLLILIMTLKKEIGQVDDPERMRRPIDSEKGNTNEQPNS